MFDLIFDTCGIVILIMRIPHKVGGEHPDLAIASALVPTTLIFLQHNNLIIGLKRKFVFVSAFVIVQCNHFGLLFGGW